MGSLEKVLIGWNRVSLHSPFPASSVGLLYHFHKIPIEVGQPVLGLHKFRNFTEAKISMASANISKSGLIVLVISYYAET